MIALFLFVLDSLSRRKVLYFGGHNLDGGIVRAAMKPVHGSYMAVYQWLIGWCGLDQEIYRNVKYRPSYRTVYTYEYK